MRRIKDGNWVQRTSGRFICPGWMGLALRWSVRPICRFSSSQPHPFNDGPTLNEETAVRTSAPFFPIFGHSLKGSWNELQPVIGRQSLSVMLARVDGEWLESTASDGHSLHRFVSEPTVPTGIGKTWRYWCGITRRLWQCSWNGWIRVPN